VDKKYPSTIIKQLSLVIWQAWSRCQHAPLHCSIRTAYSWREFLKSVGQCCSLAADWGDGVELLDVI